MSDDGYTFAGLDGHIREVDEGVVAPMRRVVEAARPLDLGAYGLIGQAFAGTASAAVADGVQAVRDLADVGGEFGAGLRRTQHLYVEAESANHDLLVGGRDG